MSEQETNNEQQETETQDLFDPIAYLETLSDIDPRLKEYVSGKEASTTEAHKNAKQARLNAKVFKDKLEQTNKELTEARSRLKDIDDKDKSEIQKLNEKISDLEKQLVSEKASKENYDLDLFLLGNGITKDRLKIVKNLLKETMAENGLDKDAAFSTIKDDGDLAWVFNDNKPVTDNSVDKTKVEKPANSGSPPQKKSPQEPKPKAPTFKRKSETPAEHRAWLRELRSQGIRID